MKSTWFGTRERYDFARLLHEADYSLRLDEVFRLFLETSFCAVYQPAHKLRTGATCEKEEASYMQSIGRIKHAKKFGEAMGVLALGLEKDPCDFLGNTMMELDLNDKNFRGQCFTPQAVSRVMAELTLADTKPVSGRTLMLSEPACGGGSMVIEASQVLKNNGFYPWDFCWQAVDVDWRCFAMTYIQTTLLGIAAEVVWGNTLSQKFDRVEWNMIAVMHPPKRDKGKDEQLEPVKPEVAKPEVMDTTNAIELSQVTQLSLF
ncbi:MAG: N-6 DNA methylase [Fuerstiella sp.]|jgi:hypothetical protein|nr:N-6 DNA methylase [Fuerstiella sp.]